MRVARRYLIRGLVQGVGFRYFTRSAALREGVHGWVRNNPDRSVEVQAEGEPDALARFERQIRQGPPGAHVDRIEFNDATPGGEGGEFHIR
jgi:acylphosphatase